jgi:hypothetical protein
VRVALEVPANGVVAIDTGLPNFAEGLPNTATAATLLRRSITSIRSAVDYKAADVFTVSIFRREGDQMVRIAAEWTQPGSSKDVVFKMHRDIVSSQIDATLLTALIKAWQSGAISHDTLLLSLKRGEVVDPNRSLEEELALIEEEGGSLAPPMPLPTV